MVMSGMVSARLEVRQIRIICTIADTLQNNIATWKMSATAFKTVDTVSLGEATHEKCIAHQHTLSDGGRPAVTSDVSNILLHQPSHGKPFKKRVHISELIPLCIFHAA